MWQSFTVGINAELSLGQNSKSAVHLFPSTWLLVCKDRTKKEIVRGSFYYKDRVSIRGAITHSRHPIREGSQSVASFDSCLSHELRGEPSLRPADANDWARATLHFVPEGATSLSQAPPAGQGRTDSSRSMWRTPLDGTTESVFKSLLR